MMIMVTSSAAAASCIVIALLCVAHANANGAHSSSRNAAASGHNNRRLAASLADAEPVIQAPAGRRLLARSEPKQPAAPPPPKLVQWAREPVQYYEGSTLILSCSLATSLAPGAALKFAWFKQGRPLLAAAAPPPPGNSLTGRVSVETLADYSILRLAQLRSGDSGAYTCVASNSRGQEDRTTAQIVVNVKLRWFEQTSGKQDGQDERNQQRQQQSSFIGGQHELVSVRAGQPVILECGAAAQPLPRIRWFRLAPPVGNQQRQATDGAGNSMPFSPGGSSLAHQGSSAARQPQFRLDETQIKSSLLQQTESADGTWPSPFYRTELANTDDLMGRARGAATTNETGSAAGRWRIEAHSSGQHELSSRLILERAEPNSSGLYECEASSSSASALESGHSGQTDRIALREQQTPADRLRRLFGVLVNGK